MSDPLDWLQGDTEPWTKVNERFVTVRLVSITSNGASHDLDPDNAGAMHRFSGTGAKTLAVDVADGFSAGLVFHVCNRGASGDVTLSPTGVTLNAPKGGTLTLEPGDTASVHFIDTDEADVFGSTA